MATLNYQTAGSLAAIEITYPDINRLIRVAADILVDVGGAANHADATRLALSLATSGQPQDFPGGRVHVLVSWPELTKAAISKAWRGVTARVTRAAVR